MQQRCISTWTGRLCPTGLQREDLGFRHALSSPTKSCLLPGQISWLPCQGHKGQDGTMPELP